MSRLLPLLTKVKTILTSAGEEGLNNDQFTLACRGTTVVEINGDYNVTIDNLGDTLKNIDNSITNTMFVPDLEDAPIGSKIFVYKEGTATINVTDDSIDGLIFRTADGDVTNFNIEASKAVVSMTKTEGNVWLIKGDVVTVGLGKTVAGHITSAGAVLQSNDSITITKLGGLGTYQVDFDNYTTPSFATSICPVGIPDVNFAILGYGNATFTVRFYDSVGAPVDTDFQFNSFIWG